MAEAHSAGVVVSDKTTRRSWWKWKRAVFNPSAAEEARAPYEKVPRTDEANTFKIGRTR